MVPNDDVFLCYYRDHNEEVMPVLRALVRDSPEVELRFGADDGESGWVELPVIWPRTQPAEPFAWLHDHLTATGITWRPYIGIR